MQFDFKNITTYSIWLFLFYFPDMKELNLNDICAKQYEKISSLEFWKNITWSKPKLIMVYIEEKNARDHQVNQFHEIFFLNIFHKNFNIFFQKENWKIGNSAELKTLRDGSKNKNTNIRKLLVVKEGDIKNTR